MERVSSEVGAEGPCLSAASCTCGTTGGGAWGPKVELSQGAAGEGGKVKLNVIPLRISPTACSPKP